ncbi:MAG: sensor histidine kinase [Cruoricaptor ignavus]|nr:sensor histidine kinase [Cruoricaptor ignavus]
MKVKKIYIHILLVIIFLLIPILSSPDLDARFTMFHVPMFRKEMLQMCLLITFFYFNFLVLIPRFFNQKKYFGYGFFVILCFLLVAILPQILIGDFTTNHKPNIGLQKPEVEDESKEFWLSVVRAFLPFLFSFLSSFFWFKSIEQEELEKAKAKAELLNLKYQLQPHFLFNILNSIYSLTLLKSDDAPNGILKLSNVMRYVVQESGAELVALEKEIQYLKDYIALQLIRTDESLDFSYTETGNPKGLKIAPLILVNFLENAFKYGFNAEENSKISVNIRIEKEILYLQIFNRIVNRTAEKESTQIGLKNTLKRLKQIYPEQHKITITDDGKSYEIYLEINLASDLNLNS